MLRSCAVELSLMTRPTVIDVVCGVSPKRRFLGPAMVHAVRDCGLRASQNARAIDNCG